MNIKVYTKVSDMTGIGEEWLLDARDNVVAVFIDGNLRCEIVSIGGLEVTKVA